MKKWLDRIGWMDVILLLGILMITIGLGMSISGKEKDGKLVIEKAKVTPTITGEGVKMIDISGEVIKPGVYKLSGDARIMDALIMAGGLSQKADRDWVEININKAERVRDGQKIYIPRNNQDPNSNPPAGGQTNASVLGSGIVNINTATATELDTLEGVGPSLAQKIISYREEKGGFRDINELKLVSGIGDKMFDKIKDKVGI